MADAMGDERLSVLEERLALVEQSLNIQVGAAASPARKGKRGTKASDPGEATMPIAPRPVRERQDNEVSISELSKHDGQDFICLAYRRVLGKEVDPDGLNYYSYELDRGQEKASILRRLASEPEALSFGCYLVD